MTDLAIQPVTAKKICSSLLYRDSFWAVVMLLPNFIGFMMFLFIPIVAAFVLSFMEYDVISPMKFIGLANYIEMFKDPIVAETLRNTIVYTIIVVPVGMVLSLNARLRFKGRDKLFVLYLMTMMVPFQVTIIPNFLQMSLYKLINTHWSLMIPPMVSAFGTFLMRQFFLTVPRELDEAAKIDGCTPFGTFWRVLLPMAKPTIASLTIFCFMAFGMTISVH